MGIKTQPVTRPYSPKSTRDPPAPFEVFETRKKSDFNVPTWDLRDYSVSGNDTYLQIITIAWNSGHAFDFFKSLNCYILATTG